MKAKTATEKIAKRSFLSKNAYDIKAWLLIVPSLILLFIVVYRPIIIGFWNSFHTMKGYEVLEFNGLQNYREVLGDSLFKTAFLNSLKYVGCGLAIGYLTPIIMALLLNELVYYKNTMRFVVYLPSIVPGVVSAMLWYLMYYPDVSGLLNTILSKFGMEPFNWLENENFTILLIIISSTWSGAGSTTIFYLASLQGVNRELYEAGVIDGMGLWARLRKITLPHIYPVALLFLVRTIMSIFQMMELPLMMTGGGPNNASLSLSLLGYRYGFVYYQTGKALALGVIQFLMLIVMTVFYFYLEKKMSDN